MIQTTMIYSEEVADMAFYYMGCIICTGGSVCKVIDGKQRLTSLTLLLIYLMNLQKELNIPQDDVVDLDSMIYATHFGKRSFNIDVPERAKCMQALYREIKTILLTMKVLRICWIDMKM